MWFGTLKSDIGKNSLSKVIKSITLLDDSLSLVKTIHLLWKLHYFIVKHTRMEGGKDTICECICRSS